MGYKKRMQKNFLLNPFCAGTIVVLLLYLFKLIDILLYPDGGLLFFEANQGLEKITYALYVGALIVALSYRSMFFKTPLKKTYFGLLFLWLAALLREMGVQHWLTKHDTTAIKLRFFTNPNNPLHEKIISGTLVIIVVGVALWLFFKYLPKIWKGFWKLNPLYWTVVTFGSIMILSQFCDRFPSRYFKATGERLSYPILEVLKLLEEGGEACLPVLFALGFIQFAKLKKSLPQN